MPGLVALFAFHFVPIAFGGYYAFTDWNGLSKVEDEVAKGHTEPACKKLDKLLGEAIDNAGEHGLSYAEAIELLDASTGAGALLGYQAAMPPNLAVIDDLVGMTQRSTA